MSTDILESYIEHDEEVTESTGMTDPYDAVSNWHRALHRPVQVEVPKAQQQVGLQHWHFSRPYYFFERHLEALTRTQTLLASISVSESVELSALERALADSMSMLQLEPGWDDGEAAPISKETWERAAGTARIVARAVFVSYQLAPPVPSIGPVSDGSIDLFWNADGHNLLINIPSDGTIAATFDGHHPDGSSITGTLTTFKAIGHLSAWLTNR